MNRSRFARRGGAPAAAAVLVLAALAAPARSQESPTITADTPYYTIHAQADANFLREMVVRLQVLGDEYAERVRMFGGMVRSRLHIWVAAKPEDYAKMGGTAGYGSTHIVNEHRLILHVPNPASVPWGNLQEVGFQHFADAALPGRAPVWAGCGLGIYYSLARWTGDGLVAGIIPADLIRQVQMDQKEGKAPPLDKVLPLDLQRWYQDPGQPDRTRKAWAMVHFLMHAEGGKYRPAFAGYVQECGKGGPPMPTFFKYFGADGKAFAAKYEQWLASPEAGASTALQTQAVVATMTSFLARAQFLKLKFAAVEEFFQAATEQKVLVDASKNAALWLPAGLLVQNLQEAQKLSAWGLDVKKVPPALVLTQQDGTVYTGTFQLQENRRPIVKVEKKEPKSQPASKPADK